MTQFWSQQDFEVFRIDGLEERMEALKERIRPKFEALGTEYTPYFSAETGQPFHYHVAKHARRTVNPPKDSWVAFAPNKRGYKALPHFQIGLWGSHVFVILAVIYEAAGKEGMAERLLEEGAVHDLPADFMVSGDHMKPEATSIGDASAAELTALLERLRSVKKGELVIGRHLPAEEAVRLSEDEFLSFATDTFASLLPVYDIMTGRVKEEAGRL